MKDTSKLPDRVPKGCPEGGQFTSNKTVSDYADMSIEELKELLQQEFPVNNGRIKVAEITNPIYDDMVLSDGKRVKDILTRVVEMPLSGDSAGFEHIENHEERHGFVYKYRGFLSDIINDPDYVFEDKVHKNTVLIEKKVDEHIIMVVSLNYDNTNYTNTIITMRHENENAFPGTIKNYEKSQKVLYKREKK